MGANYKPDRSSLLYSFSCKNVKTRPSTLAASLRRYASLSNIAMSLLMPHYNDMSIKYLPFLLNFTLTCKPIALLCVFGCGTTRCEKKKNVFMFLSRFSRATITRASRHSSCRRCSCQFCRRCKSLGGRV